MKKSAFAVLLLTAILALTLSPVGVVSETHSHNFVYSASGSQLIATCTAAGCGLDGPLTLTLIAPATAVYDGSAREASVSPEEKTAWTGAGLPLPAVTYTAATGSSLTAEGKAVGAGSYTAKITAGGATAAVDFSITKRTVTVSGIEAAKKDYDGRTDAVLIYDHLVLDGKVEGDDLGVTAIGNFDTPETGPGKTVTFTDMKLTGSAAGNYQLAATGNQDTTISAIWRERFTPSVTLADWTYGDTPAAPVVRDNWSSGEESFEYKTRGADDSAYGTTRPTAAGSYTVRVRIAETDWCHAEISAGYDFTIKRRAVTVSGISGGEKRYDGTTEAVLDYSGAVLDGKVAGDDLGVTATGTFDDPDTGDNKRVVLTGLELTGSAKDNYVLAETGQQTGTTGRIVSAGFVPTVTISDWTYGEAPAEPVLTNNVSGGAVSFEYKKKGAADGTYGAGIPTGAGRYTVRARIAAVPNYAEVVSAGTDFEIRKAEQVIRAETALTFRYGDTGKSVGAKLITGDGTLRYAVTKGDSVSVDAVTGVLTIRKPGRSTVTVTAAETDNYKEKTLRITVTVRDVPKTGDGGSPALWAMLMLTAMVGIVVIGRKARNRL